MYEKKETITLNSLIQCINVDNIRERIMHFPFDFIFDRVMALASCKCCGRAWGFSQKSVTMTNSVDPDETAHDEPSHLDLHGLQKYLYWSAGMEGLSLCIIYLGSRPGTSKSSHSARSPSPTPVVSSTSLEPVAIDIDLSSIVK